MNNTQCMQLIFFMLCVKSTLAYTFLVLDIELKQIHLLTVEKYSSDFVGSSFMVLEPGFYGKNKIV